MMTVFALVFRRLTTQRLTVALMLLFPVFIVLLPQQADEQTPVLAFGVFGLVLMFSSFLMSKQVIEDRQNRTVVRIAASPITHRDYLMGHLLAYACVMMAQVTLFFILALVRYTAPTMFFFWGYGLMVIFALMTIALSLFWHTFFKTFATSMSIYSIAANLMAVIGGMSFPLALLPDRLRSVAVILPTYWYSYGLEQASEGAITTVGLSMAILISFGIIFITIGSRRSYE